jgi:hypothetical protein
MSRRRGARALQICPAVAGRDQPATDRPRILPPDLFRIRLDRLHVPAAPIDLEIVSQADVPLAGGIGTRFIVMRGGPAPRDQVAVIVGSARPVRSRFRYGCIPPA